MKFRKKKLTELAHSGGFINEGNDKPIEKRTLPFDIILLQSRIQRTSFRDTI